MKFASNATNSNKEATTTMNITGETQEDTTQQNWLAQPMAIAYADSNDGGGITVGSGNVVVSGGYEVPRSSSAINYHELLKPV